jgi:hypothetical protein
MRLMGFDGHKVVQADRLLSALRCASVIVSATTGVDVCAVGDGAVSDGAVSDGAFLLGAVSDCAFPLPIGIGSNGSAGPNSLDVSIPRGCKPFGNRSNVTLPGFPEVI